MNNQSIENRRRGIFLLPNLLTISALFAGFYAIVAGLGGNFESSAILIFVAMLMDSLDGRVARLTNTVTSFGAELDSLCDMVSFGVAPAIIVYQYGLFVLGKFGWLAAFIYVAAVALRLARFNTQLNKVEKRYFQGLSSTAGAGLIAGLIWVAKDFAITRNFTVSIILAVITVFTGVLMVSNIRYRSFKDADLKHHVPFVVILGAVLIIVLVSLDPSQILAAIFSLYALSGPVGTIWSLRKKKKARSLLKIQGKKNS